MTSSGFTDGLGRRALAFDREGGTMLERLTVRPELAAFAVIMRERLERLSAIEDERLVRPRGIEQDPEGALVVVSEFVPGSRLSDLLDIAAEQGVAPGLDVAVGYLLDVLPALCGLHAGAGFAHGTIAPSRTVLTPAGQVVLLDVIYGGALALLRYSPRKLWTEFSIAVPLTAGLRLGVETDIGQVTLSSLMLILGRPLYADEFPDALPRVIADVVEIAQIRGGSEFAQAVRAFLHRALPLPAGQRYSSADDALIDVRELAAQLGVDACRRALVEFIAQTEPAPNVSSTEASEDDELIAVISSLGVIETDGEIEELCFDDEVEDKPADEIDLASLVQEPPLAPGFYGLAPPVAAERTAHADGDYLQSSDSSMETREIASDPEAAQTSSVPNQQDGAAEARGSIRAAGVRSRRAKRTRSARARKDKLRSAATPTLLATQKSSEHATAMLKPNHDPAAASAASAPDKPGAPDAAPAVDVEASPPKKSGAEPATEMEQGPGARWLVSPGRAESFDPPVPLVPQPGTVAVIASPAAPPIAAPSTLQSTGGQAPAPVPFIPTPMMVPVPPPIAVLPRPVPPRLPMPNFASPSGWTPQANPGGPSVQPLPVAGPVPMAISIPLTAAVSAVKLKKPDSKSRGTRPLPADEIYGSPPAVVASEKRANRWKAGAAACVTVLVLAGGGRHYLQMKTGSANVVPATSVEETAPIATPTRSRQTTPARSRTMPAPTPVLTTGRLEIETQPAGAQILLDGKAVGVSPLTLDAVPAGRHSVTLASASGSVRRIVRVEGGRTLKIDAPIYSGWVGIFAPFVVEVSEGGRVIGTTEESRLMLSPGRHVLTLTNRALGYRSVETVEIEPGEVRSVTLDPRGTVNLNASPWAEVWVRGRKAGETPLAGLQLPLGIHEVVFKHPEFGERKVMVTVKGNEPVALSVNMMK